MDQTRCKDCVPLVSPLKFTKSIVKLHFNLTVEPLSALRRPGGLARQRQLRGVREDGDERVGKEDESHRLHQR